jgi:hypothetical protein
VEGLLGNLPPLDGSVEGRETLPPAGLEVGRVGVLAPVVGRETFPVDGRETAPLEGRDTLPVDGRETLPVDGRE